MTGATRLVDAAKTTHAELAEVVLDLGTCQQRLARLRRDLAYAVTLYGGSTERPDDDHHDPRTERQRFCQCWALLSSAEEVGHTMIRRFVTVFIGGIGIALGITALSSPTTMS